MNKARKLLKSNGLYACLLLLPATLALLAIRVIPVIQGLYLGFTNRRLLEDRPTKFIGFDNFITMFTEDVDFWRVLAYTFIYTFGVVILSYCFGLFVAMLMNQKLKFRGLFRALLLVPWVVPSVVAGAAWQWSLNDQTGIVNIILKNLHIIQHSVPFLADPLIAQITTIFVCSWKNYPYMALSLLAGLQNVSDDIKEAARIDGANGAQLFFRIILPQIKSVSMVCTTLMFIWTFNNFDNIYLLTVGGPDRSTYVMSILSYFAAFLRMNMGYASAISTVMLVFMLALSVLYIRIVTRNDKD